MIALEGLTKCYGDFVAVDAVDLEVGAGELLVLLGHSGCGKTTTLKMINRLVEPSSGVVRIRGEDTAALSGPELRRRIGYGFQQVGLFPHLTVGENVGMTPSLLGWKPARIAERVEELLALVQLAPEDFRERAPHQLSGGQQQRVGLARALAAEPEVLLLDEPFGALDPLTRDHLQRALLEIRAKINVTTVFVTHDMTEALLLGDRIGVMDAGRFVQVDTPAALLRSPATPGVSELMESPRRQAARVEALLAGETEGGAP